MIFEGQIKHAVKKAGYKDVGINFIALPDFFDILFHMMRERNVIVDFLVGNFRQNCSLSQYLLFQLGEQKGIESWPSLPTTTHAGPEIRGKPMPGKFLNYMRVC